MLFCWTLQLQPSHSSKTRPKFLDGLENVDPLAGQKADLCIGMESKELWHLWWEAFLNEPGHKMAQTPPTTNMQTFFRETPKAFGDSENMKKGSISTQSIKFWCIQKVAPENDHVSPAPGQSSFYASQSRFQTKQLLVWAVLHFGCIWWLEARCQAHVG